LRQRKVFFHIRLANLFLLCHLDLLPKVFALVLVARVVFVKNHPLALLRAELLQNALTAPAVKLLVLARPSPN
jgi:hypothetical protein